MILRLTAILCVFPSICFAACPYDGYRDPQHTQICTIDDVQSFPMHTDVYQDSQGNYQTCTTTTIGTVTVHNCP